MVPARPRAQQHPPHAPRGRRLSAALSGVWPPTRAMQRRLVAAQFVPSARSEQQAEEEAAAAASASASVAAGGDAAAPSGSSGQAGGQAASAADEGPEARAAALEAALAQHCPDISLAHMQKAALALRLFLGCRAVGEQSGDGPSMQAVIRTLLLDCQQLLDLDPACTHAYVWAVQV